ncbi:MAG: serine hydrolase [Gemmatimonadota bacterium]
MRRWQWWPRAAAHNWLSAATATLTATSLTAAVFAAGALAAPAASAATQVCRSASDPTLAATMSSDIKAAFQGRTSRVGIHVDDPSLNLTCSLNSYLHFYSASTVKAIILAALLRKADSQHRGLTAKEKSEAWSMITVSDNNAATYLWKDTGRTALQHFLNLAGMSHTVLGPGGYWGLTQETAYDESLLLHLLVTPNTVLTKADRSYALYLTAHVTSSQRWGTPAGVPSRYTVHVKNGWLPVSGYGWIINSLGAFTQSGPDYTMDVLTDHNATMAYGITTIENIAVAANHDLNTASASTSAAASAATATVPRSTPSASWGKPDEVIPASMRPGH